MMSKADFCGHEPGPRTIFTLTSKTGVKIKEFSAIQSEGEVLFRPMTMLRVKDAETMIINPKYKGGDVTQSGHPDRVGLEELRHEQVAATTRL